MRNLGRLLAYVRPHAGWFLLGVGLLAVVGVLEGISALLFWPLLQLVLNPGAGTQKISLLELPYLKETVYLQDVVPVEAASAAYLVVGTIVVLFAVKAACDYLGQYATHRLGYVVVMDLRNQLYAHTLRQSLTFFYRRSTGQLMSAAINDIERVQQVVSHVLTDFLKQAFSLPVLLALLFVLDWKLALVCFLTVPLIVFPVMLVGRRIRHLSRDVQEKLGGLNSFLQETYSGIRIVHAFGREKWEVDRFLERAAGLFRVNLRWVRQYAVVSPMMEILGAVTIGGLILYSSWRIQAGLITSGMVISFVVVFLKVYQPVKRIAGIYGLVQQALGASEQVFELLDHSQEIADAPDARELPPFHREIFFENVSFGYPEGGDLLREITFTVEAGQVTAIVGSSGAGKTTLANLLPRFFDVTGGAVRIDGQDIRSVTLASLRRQIGVVTQETVLFNDTVRNNIAYGRPEVSLAAVQAAAAAALADEFIQQLPEGYDTVIGERGARLSGGQRQRLAIARALLKDAPILILDEATSELDTESEWLVQQALANLMTGRTVFVIAHRLSTVRRAGQTLVLEGGRIVERGRHEELLAQGGVYQRLYEMQFADFDQVVSVTQGETPDA